MNDLLSYERWWSFLFCSNSEFYDLQVKILYQLEIEITKKKLDMRLNSSRIGILSRNFQNLDQDPSKIVWIHNTDFYVDFFLFEKKQFIRHNDSAISFKRKKIKLKYITFHIESAFARVCLHKIINRVMQEKYQTAQNN